MTNERYRGEGAVVEFGCWLGAGTVHLAAGLRDRGSTAMVTCIDHFSWAGAAHDRAFGGDLAKGDDFEPLFRANTAFIAEHIDVLRADLGSFTWERGPIELLLVDAPKKREVVLAFLRGFAPRLIGGRSLVVFQDYLHAPSFAIPAILSVFDELQPTDVVLPGSTVGMRLTRPLDLGEERLARCDPASWSEGETLDRWAGIVEALPENARRTLALSLPFLLVSQGRIELAREQARQAAAIPEAQRSLSKWRSTYLAVMYRPVFEAAGVEVHPTTPEMHHWVSNEALKAEQLDAARDAAEQALRLNSAYGPAKRRLALIERRIEAEAARRLRSETRARAGVEATERAAHARAGKPTRASVTAPRRRPAKWLRRIARWFAWLRPVTRN